MITKETDWHYYTEHGFPYRIKVSYGLTPAVPHGQDVFWAKATNEYQTDNRHWRFLDGDPDRRIMAYVPEIAPYLKWRQVGPKGPLFYLDNARFWLRGVQGKERIIRRDEDVVTKFKEAIRLGAFPGDHAPAELEREFRLAERRAAGQIRGPKEWAPGGLHSDFAWPKVRDWLEARLPDLIAAWTVDMAELGLLEE